VKYVLIPFSDPSPFPIPNSQVLSYGAVRPRRRALAATVIIGLVIITGICAHRWGGQAWRRAEILYWQSRCLKYDGNPRHVVCEERVDLPTTVESRFLIDRTDRRGTRLVEPSPKCFLNFMALNNWITIGGVRTASTEAVVVFCHRRKSPAGHERLVVVTRRVMRFQKWEDDIDFGECFGFHIITAGTLSSPPTDHIEIGGPLHAKYGPILSYSKCTRFFEGIADPSDESRFTIGYEMDGVPGVIDGQLRDEKSIGDDVDLRMRSGPAFDPTN